MSNRIRELRDARGMTQAELAWLVGVTEGVIRRWESGTAVPRERNQKQLARKLGVSVDDLGLEQGDRP